MRPRSGFTLIELLVSITLGMILLTMGTSALMQVSKIAKRDTAQRQAHDEIAILHRRLEEGVTNMYHPSQVRVEAYKGPDGEWDTGDEWITIIWMASLRDKNEGYMEWDSDFVYTRELLWHQLLWKGDGEGGGELFYGKNTNLRSNGRKNFLYENSDPSGAPIKRNYGVRNAPQWRRDRRRDLDDNDFRWIPGMRKDFWSDTEIEKLGGDREDLMTAIKPALAPTTEVGSLTIEWVDAGGVVV